jgi:hypothetical protein
MSTGNRQVGFNVEQKLAELNLTPSQRHQALGAIKVAEDVIDVVQFFSAFARRVAGAVSLKPSVRT